MTTTSTELKDVRGPVLGLPHLLQLRYNPIRHNAFLRNAYGEIFRLNVFGVRMYVTAGADTAEQVLVNRDRTFANGPAWSHFIGPFFHRGIMLLDFDEHLHHRRILQHAFTNDALRSYHAVMAPHIRRNLASWEAAGPAGRPPAHHVQGVDPRPRPGDVRRCRPGAGGAGEGQQGVHRRGPRRHLDHPQADPGRPVGQGPEGSRVPRGLLPVTPAGQASRRGKDLFAQLCSAQSEDGHEFSDDDIVNHMIFLLMAAHDTTTITLSSMAYHLAKHPEWQERARQESVAAGEVDYDGVMALDVLDRVMKESMRLCSPVPTLPRVAVRDTEIAGFRIPAGSFVTVSPYMNHYLPELWPDPTRFDPDRFAPDRREDRSHRLAFEPFGAGVHKCIGMHFAGMQVRAIFHELLRSYRWSVPADYVWPLDLTALPFPRDGVPVTLEAL